MTDWFTADLHLLHDKVAQLRGFNSTQHHDNTIMDNLTDTLNPGDRLWILGDLTLTDERGALEELASINPQVELHLISGNHDACHPMHRNSEAAQKRFLHEFDSVDSMGTFRHNKAKVLLSHFPYDGDHTEGDRYAQHRLRDLGAPLIHGHTHSTQQISHSTKGTLQICVSLDAWDLKPASKEDLTKLINQEPEAGQGKPLRPEDVPGGEAWRVLLFGKEEYNAIRSDGDDWFAAHDDGTTFFFESTDATLLHRLIPEE